MDLPPPRPPLLATQQPSSRRWQLSGKKSSPRKRRLQTNSVPSMGIDSVPSIPATAQALERANKENDVVLEQTSSSLSSKSLPAVASWTLSSSSADNKGRTEIKQGTHRGSSSSKEPPTTPAAMAAAPTVYHQIERRRKKLQEIPSVENSSTVDVLDLACNDITTLNGMQKFKAARKLFLFDNKLEVLDKIEDNRLLEELYVQLNKIETVKLKKQMPRLTSLRIDGNAITSLEFLPQLQNLRYLNISDNPLKNIRGIGLLKNLRALKASNCGINSVEEIIFCGNLEELILDSNPIKNLGKLNALKSLESFSLQDSKLTDRMFENVGACYSIISLSIAGNRVSNLSTIAKLFPNTAELDISRNGVDAWNEQQVVESLRPLQALRSLRFDKDIEDSDHEKLQKCYTEIFPNLMFVNEVEFSVEAENEEEGNEDDEEEGKDDQEANQVLKMKNELPTEPPRIDEEEIKELRKTIEETKGKIHSETSIAEETLSSAKPLPKPVNMLSNQMARSAEVERLERRVKNISLANSGPEAKSTPRKSSSSAQNKRGKLGATVETFENELRTTIGNDTEVRTKLEALREMRNRRLNLMDDAMNNSNSTGFGDEYRQITASEQESILSLRRTLQSCDFERPCSSLPRNYIEEEAEADVHSYDVESEESKSEKDSPNDDGCADDFNQTQHSKKRTNNAPQAFSPKAGASSEDRPCSTRVGEPNGDIDSTISQLMDSVFREAAETQGRYSEPSHSVITRPSSKKGASLSKYLRFAKQMKTGDDSSDRPSSAHSENTGKKSSTGESPQSSEGRVGGGPRSGVLAAALRYSRSSEPESSINDLNNETVQQTENNPPLSRRPSTASLPRKEIKSVKLFDSNNLSARPSSSSGVSAEQENGGRARPLSGRAIRPDSSRFMKRRKQ